MTMLIRLRDWWLGQFRATGRLGKVVWVGVPLLFTCCGLSMCSLLVSPPDVEPTAAVAERAATVELVEAVATDEPATATELPVRDPATATSRPDGELRVDTSKIPTVERTSIPRPTARPTNTPRPSATPVPATATQRPVPAATAVAATVAAAQPTIVPTNTAAPIVVPPTATVVPPTEPPATVAPTEPPLPTAPPVAAPGDVVISSIRYDGDVPQVESDEYAVITNRGAAVVNLSGWRLNAGEPDQNFGFPSFDLQPGQSCRVYTNEVHPDTCGFSFGRGNAIWRNSGDCGTLHDASGAEVSRYCW